MKLNHADDTPTDYGLQLTKFDEQVISRHHKVAEIIRRHLKEIREEVLHLDPETMNIDNAGDRAEIARQVLGALVDQLRGLVHSRGSTLQTRRNCTGGNGGEQRHRRTRARGRGATVLRGRSGQIRHENPK